MRAFLAAAICCVPLAACAGANLSLDADRPQIHEAVTAAALEAGVPVNIAHAVVKLESGYNPRARSSAGALGIMQVLPRTARAMGEDGRSLASNLRAGMKYLALALRSSTNLCAAISAYNHGIAGRPYCTSYGRKVLGMAK